MTLFTHAAARTALRPLAELAKQKRAEAALAMPEEDEYASEEEWQVRLNARTSTPTTVVMATQYNSLCLFLFRCAAVFV